MPGNFDELTGTTRPPEEGSLPGSTSGSDNDSVSSELSSNTATPAVDPDNYRTSAPVREVAKELTRYGLIEASRKPNLYRVLRNEQRALAAILEPLDLDLAIDDVRGIGFVKLRSDDNELPVDEESDPEDWSHPLVRRQRLTLEQSLLVAILRQHFVAHEQEAGVGADDARVSVDDLMPEFQIYLGDSGSEAKERSRMLTLLDQLKGHGLVSEPDGHERVTIRPIIAHLASPENLQQLLAWLRKRRQGDTDDSDDSATRTSMSDPSP